MSRCVFRIKDVAKESLMLHMHRKKLLAGKANFSRLCHRSLVSLLDNLFFLRWLLAKRSITISAERQTLGTGSIRGIVKRATNTCKTFFYATLSAWKQLTRYQGYQIQYEPCRKGSYVEACQAVVLDHWTCPISIWLYSLLPCYLVTGHPGSNQN